MATKSSVSDCVAEASIRKAKLRKIFRSLKLCAHLSVFQWDAIRRFVSPGSRLGVYIAYPDEVFLPLDLLRRRFSLLFPRLVSVSGDSQAEAIAEKPHLRKEQRLVYGELPGLKRDDLCGLSHNSDFPRFPLKFIVKDEIPAVLVPCLAVDREGYRLGRGGGHFDYFFQDFRGLKIGVVRSDQWVNTLPREPHDIPLDIIVSEKEEALITRKKWVNSR